MKKLLSLALVACTLLFPAGCDAQQALEDVGNEVKAGGREHGETYDLKQDESMTTAFFDLKVNSAALRDDFSGYVPNDDSHKFLVVNVTIDNTFTDDASIPMYYNDFELSWEGLDDSRITAESDFADDGVDEMLPDEYEIYKGESRTGNLVFEVPSDKDAFSFIYEELYEDDFTGNVYKIAISPEAA